MNWQDFQKLEPTKHNADCDVDDILWLNDSNAFSYEKRHFIKVICSARCGKDEFIGFQEDPPNKEVSWSDNDIFKIVGTMTHAHWNLWEQTKKKIKFFKIAHRRDISRPV